MTKNDLKKLLKEFGDPSIEDVHSNLADTLKHFSDNYGEITLSESGKSTCLVNTNDIINVLNVLTTATVWLKVNRENFKE